MGKEMANTVSTGFQNSEGGGKSDEFTWNGTPDNAGGGIGEQGGWPAEPGMGRMVDGVAGGVDRLKALGNGQVPRVAKTAWRLLGGP